MDLRRVWAYLMAGPGCQDDGFAGEIQRLHLTALRVIGRTEIAAALFVFLARMLVNQAAQPFAARAWPAALVVLVGLLTLAVAQTRAARSHPSALLCFSAWLSSSALIASSLLVTDEYLAAQIATIVLASIAVAPLRPRETFAMSSSIWLSCLAALVAAWQWKRVDPAAWDLAHLVFLALLTLLATTLSAILYAQRCAHHRAQQESVRMAEFLAAAPVRALLSENAISVGHLAAALTHELNTPLGALKSSIDTMVVLAAKQATAPPEAQPRLVSMQSELRHSVNDCMERLKSVIARLQRFIDLHHTERQPSNLIDLLGDVAILLKPALTEHVTLEFHFQPIPPVTCRPQQLTTVFSSLLSNAIAAVHGQGCVQVSTHNMDSMVRVRVQDNGSGMEESELETIFDPGFKVTAGRVSTGNWGLFSSRQIVFEHGGEIQITSTPGKGTTVDVLLPI
jgi:signal transduction histidine kinase